MKLQYAIKSLDGTCEVQIAFTQSNLSARFTIDNRVAARQSKRPKTLSLFRSVAQLFGITGTNQEVHLSDSATIVADGRDDAALLLDMLLVHLNEGCQYKNPTFIVQRNYDREKAARGYQMYHTYNYEIFHLKLGFVGRLSPSKFEEMSAEIRKVYSTSEPLGEYNSWVDRFEPPSFTG